MRCARCSAPDADNIVITNTKGFTGHAMGAGIEDVVAIKSLETGLVPPVPNYKEPDPELGHLNLSTGGDYPVEYALRLGAGFGSQIAMTLMRWTPVPDGRHRLPDELGYQYRIVDQAAWRRWLAATSGSADAALEVVQRRLRVVDTGPPGRGCTARPGADANGAARPVGGRNGIAGARAARHSGRTSGTRRTRCPGPGARTRDRRRRPDRQPSSAIVAEPTGYPPDLLDVDLDLEADLGVDTVKQAEIFAAVRGPSASHATTTSNCATSPPSPTSSAGSATRPAPPHRPAAPGATAAAPAAQPRRPPHRGTGTRGRRRRPDRQPSSASSPNTPATRPTCSTSTSTWKPTSASTPSNKPKSSPPSAERYGVARDDNLKLRDFPTLTHVVGWIRDKTGPPRAAPAAPSRRRRRPRRRPRPRPAARTRGRRRRRRPTPSSASSPNSPATRPTCSTSTSTWKPTSASTPSNKPKSSPPSARHYGVARDDNLKLRDFPTLTHVVGWVRDKTGPRQAQKKHHVTPAAATPGAAAVTQTVKGDIAATDRIPRRVPVASLRPDLEACLPTGVELAAGTRVVGDARPRRGRARAGQPARPPRRRGVAAEPGRRHRHRARGWPTS